MQSYIAIHHFTPPVHFEPIENLYPLIDTAMVQKGVAQLIGTEKTKEFREKIMACMRAYYRLVGVDKRSNNREPFGVLPRFTESLMRYFSELGAEIPPNKEISILRFSGVRTIKIRYKYTDSVIKKLVKLGLRDLHLLEDPLRLFLRNGALHDLVGILFVCTYPYEKEWVARSLYNFFEYEHRTDDHLLYGFYTVTKESGYHALHCDETSFSPRFDSRFSQTERAPEDLESIFHLLESDDDTMTVLRKLAPYFNIEIQLRSQLENVWADMEHANSYDKLAKGEGREREITVQWRLLSESLKNIELQLQQLQIDTEQSRFKDERRIGYTFVRKILSNLDPVAERLFERSSEKVESLRLLFIAHEISRQDYVRQLKEEAELIENFAERRDDPIVSMIFRMQSAYIYYRLANHFEYFNLHDIRQFARISLDAYRRITRFFCNNRHLPTGDLLHVISILRYLRLAQKYELGLIAHDHKDETSQAISLVPYQERLRLFSQALRLLGEMKEEELDYLREDNAAYLKVVHRFDVMAREWELFKRGSPTFPKEEIEEQIAQFRFRFITPALVSYFNTLLYTNKIKEVGFLIQFYATLIWHGLYLPLDALREIIRLSAYDHIATSHLFYYELAAYRFLVIHRCETLEDCEKPLEQRSNTPQKIVHYENYHRENMIGQLFRIRREEPENIFEKAKIQFEQITGSRFRLNQFSDTIMKQQNRSF